MTPLGTRALLIACRTTVCMFDRSHEYRDRITMEPPKEHMSIQSVVQGRREATFTIGDCSAVEACAARTLRLARRTVPIFNSRAMRAPFGRGLTPASGTKDCAEALDAMRCPENAAVYDILCSSCSMTWCDDLVQQSRSELSCNRTSGTLL